MPAAEFDQPLIGLLLFGKAIFHDFNEEISLAKNIPVLFRGADGFFGISPEQMGRNLAMETGAHSDQSLTGTGSGSPCRSAAGSKIHPENRRSIIS